MQTYSMTRMRLIFLQPLIFPPSFPSFFCMAIRFQQHFIHFSINTGFESYSDNNDHYLINIVLRKLSESGYY